MEFLLNPWVIILIVVGVVVGNIAALKYTANAKFGAMGKDPREKSDLDKLNELDKANRQKKEAENTDTKKDA